MLKQDKELNLATQEEFLQKVKCYLEENFIWKVKDLAKATKNSPTSWGDILSDVILSILFLSAVP